MALGDGAVTLAVTGAGASFDCGWHRDTGARNGLTHPRPPLTNDLLDEFEFLGGNLDLLLSEIDRRRRFAGSSFSLEDCIFEIYRSVAQSSQTDQQFLAFRRAVGGVFERFEQISSQASTNYTKLISKYWATRSRDDLLVILNLNYDSLAEHALGSRQSFRDFQSYLATTNRPVSLLHPHGTSRWFEAPLGFTEVEPSPSDGGVEVLANGTTLIAIGRRGDVWHNPEGHELVPAISIPMRGDFTSKTRWPQSQLEEFERFGPKVTRIVSIGWAARDQHILELLGKHVPRDAPVHVVSMGDADTIARRFRGVGFSSVTHESNGFSTFCDSTSTPSSGLDTIFGVGAAGAVDPPPS